MAKLIHLGNMGFNLDQVTFWTVVAGTKSIRVFFASGQDFEFTGVEATAVRKYLRECCYHNLVSEPAVGTRQVG